MMIHAEIDQVTIDKESLEKDFRYRIQGILDDSYQVEGLLRGIQALGDSLIGLSSVDEYAPVHIVSLSIELEKMINAIIDKAQDAETLFYGHLKGKVSQLYRKVTATIYAMNGYTAILTTDHSSSRYGIPVLVVNGRRYP